MSQAFETIYAGLAPVSACPRCLNSGLWLSPKNQVLICPKIMLREQHIEQNKASLILTKASSRLMRQSYFLPVFEFEIARILTNYSKVNRCQRQLLVDFLFADSNLDEAKKLRKFHQIIENLQKIWLLPIGSQKQKPFGYWFITDLADYKGWIESAKAAPITRLTTIHANARFNYPEFAEQLELEFWQDITPEQEVLA